MNDTGPVPADAASGDDAIARLEALVEGMTPDEKAALVSGRDFWRTAQLERLGIESVMLTDGPHGLRKQLADPDGLGLVGAVPATCFPTAATLGSTWDVDLVHRVAVALGVEARANEVCVLLGPGVNIKRSPLCGRNFEYLSEDPVLTGRLGAALVEGIQSQGVGASLKHFAANNQETDRMRVSAQVDERTLREMYLAAFEHIVRTATPWTVMCSYNRINGVPAAQDHWLLTEVLRQEWGYEGLVLSDWGAVSDPAASIRAGLDLEMPTTQGRSSRAIVQALRDGELADNDLDRAVRNVLALIDRAKPALAAPGVADLDLHHELAREAAAAGTVLLVNDPVDGRPVLPLGRTETIGVVGEFARTARYQGAGSSRVTPTRIDTLLEGLRVRLGRAVPFEPGFGLEDTDDGSSQDAVACDADLRDAAVRLAERVDVVVLALGLPAAAESEGYDRTTLDLPANQVAALEAIIRVNPRVVVVLANGGVVVAPWRAGVPAILEAWLGGQAAGSALADVLLGACDPGGRLAETIPLRLEDTPSFGAFPGDPGVVRYGEGVLVGYRWYDTRDLPVAYCFGHGLSYTTFEYGRVAAVVTGTGPAMRVEVAVEVTNTGPRPGSEVVQVYLGRPGSAFSRPPRELKGFAKAHLGPGESRTVRIELCARDLSSWHQGRRRWVIEGGRFVIEVGASSRDIRGTADIVVGGDDAEPLGRESTIGEWLADARGAPLMSRVLVAGPTPDEGFAAMMPQMPARVVASFGVAGLDLETLDALVEAVANVPR